jgi:hypothetical protein
LWLEVVREAICLSVRSPGGDRGRFRDAGSRATGKPGKPAKRRVAGFRCAVPDGRGDERRDNGSWYGGGNRPVRLGHLLQPAVRRHGRELGPAADVTFGARVNTLQGALTFKGPDIEFRQDKTWVDPIAGVTLRTPAGRPVQLRVYSEIGGFGLGSDFTWQVFPNVGIRLTRSASLELGYRWLDLDYASGEGTGEFRYDVLTQGPVVGFGLRF